MPGGCEGFIHCNADAGDFGVGHTAEMEEVSGGVYDGDVHIYADFAGFLFRGGDSDFSTFEGEDFDMFGCHSDLVYWKLNCLLMGMFKCCFDIEVGPRLRICRLYPVRIYYL